MMRRKAIRAELTQVETDLIPIMNLFTALVPFLLVSAAFYKMSVIDVSIPAVGESVKAKLEKEEPYLSVEVFEEELKLKVIGMELNDSEEDFFERTISGVNQGALSREAVDKFDEYILLVKAHFQASEKVVLRVQESISYKHVIRIMDILRGQRKIGTKEKYRFPNIVIAGAI
tara:strand:- start:138 stop:656 length:519 start_codon:yes stop_codon:yes gene_type:complete